MVAPCLRQSGSLNTYLGGAHRIIAPAPGSRRNAPAQRRLHAVIRLATDASAATTKEHPDGSDPSAVAVQHDSPYIEEHGAAAAELEPPQAAAAQDLEQTPVMPLSGNGSESDSAIPSTSTHRSQDDGIAAKQAAAASTPPSTPTSSPTQHASDPFPYAAAHQPPFEPTQDPAVRQQSANGRTSQWDGQQGGQTPGQRAGRGPGRVKKVDISDAMQFPGLLPTMGVMVLGKQGTQPASLPRSKYLSRRNLTELGSGDPWMDRQLAAIQLDLEQDFQLKRAVRLHNITFSDMVAASNHFWRLLHRHIHGQPIPPPFHFQLLALLKKGHYNAEQKIGAGVEYFCVGEAAEYRSTCFIIHRTDGTVEDFSYRKCVSNLFTSNWQSPDGPSVMAVLRGCATVFLAREHIYRDPTIGQLAHHKLYNLCCSLRIDLPPSPVDAAQAALSHWVDQRALHEQGYPSAFNPCMAAHTLQTLARLCKADPACRQLVAETEVVQQVLEALHEEVDTLSPHHTACVLWELHSLRYFPPPWLLERLQRGVVQRSGSVQLQPMDSVRVVEALLGLDLRAGGLVTALLAEVDTDLQAGGRLGMQLLVSLLRTCARLRELAPAAVPQGMPQLLLEAIDRQPVEQLAGSQVLLMLWAMLRLRLQPGQRLLRAAAEVSFSMEQAALVPQVWTLLVQLRYVPMAGDLVTLETWAQQHTAGLHPRGLQRLTWALGRFASVHLVPPGAARLAVVACLQRAAAVAAAMQPPCPLPTATACLWAVVQQGAVEDVTSFEALWEQVNGDPKVTFETLRLLPRPLVARMVLLQLLEVGDALQAAASQLPPLHHRLRHTAEAAFPAADANLEEEEAEGPLTAQEALRRAAQALGMSEGNTVEDAS